jgi:hypothetical protein
MTKHARDARGSGEAFLNGSFHRNGVQLFSEKPLHIVVSGKKEWLEDKGIMCYIWPLEQKRQSERSVTVRGNEVGAEKKIIISPRISV